MLKGQKNEEKPVHRGDWRTLWTSEEDVHAEIQAGRSADWTLTRLMRQVKGPLPNGAVRVF